MPEYVIYGANGYTGTLIAREAVAQAIQIHPERLQGADAHATTVSQHGSHEVLRLDLHGALGGRR